MQILLLARGIEGSRMTSTRMTMACTQPSYTPGTRARRRRLRMTLLILVLLGTDVSLARADTPVFDLEIRDHLFYPPQLVIPAGRKVKLRVHNTDATPEEFESYELNREKVVMGGQRSVIFIGPLAPGRYPFFGEFNPQTAQGEIVAQ